MDIHAELNVHHEIPCRTCQWTQDELDAEHAALLGLAKRLATMLDLVNQPSGLVNVLLAEAREKGLL